MFFLNFLFFFQFLHKPTNILTRKNKLFGNVPKLKLYRYDDIAFLYEGKKKNGGTIQTNIFFVNIYQFHCIKCYGDVELCNQQKD